MLTRSPPFQVVVPSESKQILNTPLHRFVTMIKAPFGSTDGIDKYPGKFKLLLGPFAYI